MRAKARCRTPQRSGPRQRATAARWPARRGTAAEALDLVEFRLGAHAVAVERAYEQDRDAVTACWQPHADSFDLAEPFDRIREAIAKAQTPSPSGRGPG